MARVLIVGCGCRGRALAGELIAHGLAVRGTTRDPAKLAAIEAAGAEAVLCDPDRLATLRPALEHATVLVLLLGSAVGPLEQVRALHQDRLEALLRTVLDTTVRGLVYEAAGDLPADLLRAGAQTVARECERSRIPFAVVRSEPEGGWLPELAGAVERVLSDGEAAASRTDGDGP
jgi:uncharacterized protein YbjT (DUF2867 family)